MLHIYYTHTHSLELQILAIKSCRHDNKNQFKIDVQYFSSSLSTYGHTHSHLFTTSHLSSHPYPMFPCHTPPQRSTLTWMQSGDEVQEKNGCVYSQCPTQAMSTSHTSSCIHLHLHSSSGPHNYYCSRTIKWSQLEFETHV